MNILLFAPAFPPFANPEAIVNGKLALAFLAEGWHVDVVSRNLAAESDYNYGSAWVEPWMPLRAVTHVVSYPVANRFRRVVDAAVGGWKAGAFIPGCRWAAHAMAVAGVLQRGRRYDVVVSRSGPEAAHLAALGFVRTTRLPWVANWNDPADDQMPGTGGGTGGGRGGSREKRFRARVVRAASWHTFPAERLRRHVTGYLGAEAHRRSSVIPHCALAWEGRAAPGPAEQFVLCHAGFLGSGRDPGPFLEGLALFLKNERARDVTRLLLLGLVPPAFEDRARELGLGGLIEHRGALGYRETLAAVGGSDVAVVIEAPGDEGIFLPSKFVDYVQTGRPILAVSPRRGTLPDLMALHGGGIAADCTSPGEIAQALSTLFRSRREGTLDERFGSQALRRLFAPATVIAHYRRIFSKLGVPGRMA